MRHIAANVISLMIVGGIALAGLISHGKSVFRAPGERAEAVIVNVPPGASLATTTRLLHEAGAIESPMVFRLATRYARRDGDIKFGEYEIPPDASMEEVLGVITSGRSIQYKVTVPEGLTSHQVVALLGEAEILTGEVGDVPPEGAVAPDTHFVAREADRGEVLARMVAAQDRILAEAWENRAQDLPLETPEEMLI
ncbi:MAG: endolytic transglycosylase MltG, partial [Pseudomonadota bacterium]